jgi:(p)ppGpp synthase/HD superfamily hydrolase
MELYDLALEIATKAHKGQTRKFGVDKDKPYVIHPMRVAKAVYKNYKDVYPNLQKIRAVALLHDTIEDTPLTKSALVKKGIPNDVAEAVKILSKRKNENYYKFVQRIVKGEYGIKFPPRYQMALIVKIEDIKDNMSDLKEGSMKDKYRMALHILEEELDGYYERGIIDECIFE